jgi:hypothetical protein
MDCMIWICGDWVGMDGCDVDLLGVGNCAGGCDVYLVLWVPEWVVVMWICVGFVSVI